MSTFQMFEKTIWRPLKLFYFNGQIWHLKWQFGSFLNIIRKMDTTPDPNTRHVHYLDPTCDRFHGGLISIIDIKKQTAATPVFTGLVQTLNCLITLKSSTIFFFTKSDKQKSCLFNLAFWPASGSQCSCCRCDGRRCTDSRRTAILPEQGSDAKLLMLRLFQARSFVPRFRQHQGWQIFDDDFLLEHLRHVFSNQLPD